MSPESAQNVSKVSTQFCQFACLSNQKRDQKRERTKVSETWHENVNQKWSVCSHRWQAASRAARRSATRRSALACDGGVFLSFSVYFEPFFRSNSASKQTSKRTPGPRAVDPNCALPKRVLWAFDQMHCCEFQSSRQHIELTPLPCSHNTNSENDQKPLSCNFNRKLIIWRVQAVGLA